MSILLNLQNINLVFGQKVIFKNTTLNVQDTDKIGLLGLNGHGKSSLLRIITKEVEPDTSTPSFIYDKNSKLDLMYIPQQIELSAFEDLNIHTYYLIYYPQLLALHRELWIIEAEMTIDYTDQLMKKHETISSKIEGLGNWDIQLKYESYIKFFGLFDLSTKLVDLSGGMQKKLAISVGLSCKANLVLWDEPTNHLDVEAIEYFEDEVQKQTKAFIMVSHDRYLLGNICNRITHIHNGELRNFKGNYLEYLEHLNELEIQRQGTLTKLGNKHRRELAWMRQGIKARGTRSKKRVEAYNDVKGEISSLKSQAKKLSSFNLDHSGRKTKELVEVKEGSFAYKNEPSLLENLNVKLFKGDKVALLGANGVGKSTLIKILESKVKLSSGSIKSADRLDIKVFTQNRDSLDESKTPFEIIGDGQDFVHLPSGQSLHVISYLENFLFRSNEIKRPIDTLSGGEKNRLQLALFMKESADLWVFDEPTNDLDIETIEILEKLLKEYKSSVIIISHDRSFLDSTANKSWVISNKTITSFEGGYTQVAPFIEALKIEEKTNAAKKKVQDSQETTAKDKNKLSNKEKMQLKTIDADIEKTEKNLKLCQEELATFDFSQMDQKLTDRYDFLLKDQKRIEAELEKYYELWEYLEDNK